MYGYNRAGNARLSKNRLQVYMADGEAELLKTHAKRAGLRATEMARLLILRGLANAGEVIPQDLVRAVFAQRSKPVAESEKTEKPRVRQPDSGVFLAKHRGRAAIVSARSARVALMRLRAHSDHWLSVTTDEISRIGFQSDEPLVDILVVADRLATARAGEE